MEYCQYTAVLGMRRRKSTGDLPLNKTLRAVLASLLVVFAIIVHAEETTNPWEFSIGISYRTVGDVAFRGVALRRPDGGQFVNGRHVDGDNFVIEGDSADTAATENVSPQLELVGWQEIDPDGNAGTTADNNGDESFVRNVSFDESRYLGDQESPDAAWGLVQEARRRLDANGRMWLSCGLGLFQTDADTRTASGGRIATTTHTGILFQTGGVKPADDRPRTPYEERADVVLRGGPKTFDMTDNLFNLGAARTTDVAVDLDAEARWYVFSFGLELQQSLSDRFTVRAGVGPTLTIVDSESSLRQRATWNAPGNALDGNVVPGFASRESDRSFDYCAGGYAAMGIRCQLAAPVALELGCRYDEVVKDAHTRHAEFDLDGFSVDGRVVLRF